MSREERRFKELVRSAKGVLRQEDVGDLAKVYQRIGLPASEVMSTGVAGKALYGRIQTALAWSDKETGLSLDKLERHLVLRHLADGAQLLDCISLLSNLKEATRMKGWVAPPFSEARSWLEALGAAKDYHKVYRRSFVQEPYLNPRDRSVAAGVRKLRESGFRVRIEDGRAVMSDVEERRVADHLEREIGKLGGIEVAASLFERMRHWYDREQGRHHIVRRLSTTGTNDGTPVTPVGYVLNLAAKHPDPQPFRETWGAEADRMIALAEAFTDILNLRPFSTFEALFKDHDTLIPFLREVVLYDGAYALVQTRPGDMSRILSGLFDWVPATDRLGSGWTVPEFADVVEAVAAECAGLRGPAVISKQQVVNRVGAKVPAATVAEIMDVCSHASAAVNAEYRFPWDQAEATLWMKPFIKDGADHLVMDPPWCFPAFFDVLAGQVEALGKYQVNRLVGPALERVVQAELRQRGVSFATGKYNVGGIEGECDVVVETADTIILIEIKKRPLQRAARGGDPVALLADLSEALFYAQEQAARHELVLYRDGQLVLTENGRTHTIVRGAREVERIALAHLDYGSLQDRLVLFEVLRLLSGASLTTTDAAQQAVLTRLEERAKKLLQRHEELDKLRPPHQHNPFHHCWFLSLGHLLVMLDHVRSNEDFWKALRQTRSMTTGSLDFYFEYAQARRIRGASAASPSVVIRPSST